MRGKDMKAKFLLRTVLNRAQKREGNICIMTMTS